MQTTAGIKLTKKQIKQVKALQKLAKDWDKDLWIFAAAGSFCVMLKGDTEQNPIPEYNGESANTENLVDIIYGIHCDGGDW